MSRLTVEEKKQRMIQLLHEKQSFFQLKELEVLAPKEKGIPVNSVKSILDSLIDDEIIETDKIDGSIYFWAFPGKALQQKRKILEELEKEIYCQKFIILKLEAEVNQLPNLDKDDFQERLQLTSKISDLECRLKVMREGLEQWRTNDPNLELQVQKSLEATKTAANRWIDNIFKIQSWCKNKFGIESKVFYKQFHIPDTLDYLG